jgi:hypothetical protein
VTPDALNPSSSSESTTYEKKNLPRQELLVRRRYCQLARE